jgi:hypothetical protein
MISRRAIVASLLGTPLFADDPAREVWDRLAAMAAALGQTNAGEFLRDFDRSMPGYEELRLAVQGLLARCEVESSIDPVENSGDDRRRTLEADWQMHLVDRDAAQHITVRRATVKCSFEKDGRRWKVTSFAPLDFFAAPSPHADFAHDR